jgi:regulator of sirC expression with transglutaminase-like and TPR domain
MAREISAGLPGDALDAARLAALNRYLFEEHGFHGSRGEYYYHRSNSYVNEVLDDREGLPLTLSVIYVELARRLGLKVEGVALPGHFVVRYIPAEGPPQWIDVFDRAAPLTPEDVSRRVLDATGEAPAERDLEKATARIIVVRMLHNLMRLAGEDPDALVRYLDTILAISPRNGQDRFFRAYVHFRRGHRDLARRDVEWLMEHHPADVDLNKVDELRRQMEGPPR